MWLTECRLASLALCTGQAGRYLLHVRLRKQATALPGSPFTLDVEPGPAWALSTSLPFEKLVAEVGAPEPDRNHL